MEYNYFVEIIEEIFNYEHNYILNEMIKIINYDRNVLSKDNIDCLENLLKFELDNAITYQEWIIWLIYAKYQVYYFDDRNNTIFIKL